MQRKLAALLFIRTLRHGKEDPYLMARCGYRLANLYIRLNEPQKAQWAASFIPHIRGMDCLLYTSVPEPAAASLGLFGAALLAARRKRS